MSEVRRIPLPAIWSDGDGRRLLSVLDGDRGATRFVGGWVRDTLLNLQPVDIDLGTRLTPDEVIGRAEAAGIALWTSKSGIAHGTVTLMLGKLPIEVTTLRRDMTTDGRRATVSFTDDWREDAARRDFTINALSADPTTGIVHDYFDGLADLDARRVRFIGDPLVRIAEDHLRILRFFRFHARFGAETIDAPSLAACIARANDLMALSRERIADELLKTLAIPNPRPTIALMVDHAILQPVLPEIEAGALPRLDRLIAREAGLGVPPDRIRRLSATLPRNPAAAEAVGARLKLSNALRRRLANNAGPQPPSDHPLRFAHHLEPGEAIDRYLLSDHDDTTVAAALAALQGWSRPDFPLKGGDLIAMGLVPGPRVAAMLNALIAEWVAADYPDADWVRARALQAARSSQ